MLTTTHTPRHRELGPFPVFAVFAGMIVTLFILIQATPTVLAHSTTWSTALLWVGPWAIIVLMLALLSWWVAHRTGVGVRDGYGIVPRWVRSPRHLVRTEHALDAAILGGLALAVYLILYAFIWLTGPGPAAGGWLPVVLFTQTATAIISELVLLGALAALLTTTRMSTQTFVLISMGGRIVIAEPHWPAIVAAGVSGLLIAALYVGFRRLTPILVGHVAATTVVALTGTWVSSLT
ncbi:hypothetical protein NE857_26245 [Nocardiopsis exhalans]|uniref:CAAX protease self-immunity n=1 Tax=Nocardiopsis exhalans TaxID=163604 RepID=A0ABY5D5H7_9ACTN|nr:hypothetical protein [Nocardiopsis exhalans]USY18753.1 hypothetical protein NE857_26245 [Nocardiopsis exhalans]